MNNPKSIEISQFQGFLENCSGTFISQAGGIQSYYDRAWKNILLSVYNGEDHMLVGKYYDLTGIKSYGLEMNEAFAILCHTGQFSDYTYNCTNLYYQDNKCLNYYHDSILNGLYKIQPYNAKTIFRMVRNLIDNDYQKTIQYYGSYLNKRIKVSNFLPTFPDNVNNSKIVIEIKTKKNNSSARSLANITSKTTENEVLLIKNACFKILNVSPTGYIMIEEIDFSVDCLEFHCR